MTQPVAGAVLDLRAYLARNGTTPGNNDDPTAEWHDVSGNANHGTLTGFAGTTASGWAGTGTLADPYRLVSQDLADKHVLVAPSASLNSVGPASFTVEAVWKLPTGAVNAWPSSQLKYWSAAPKVLAAVRSAALQQAFPPSGSSPQG